MDYRCPSCAQNLKTHYPKMRWIKRLSGWFHQCPYCRMIIEKRFDRNDVIATTMLYMVGMMGGVLYEIFLDVPVALHHRLISFGVVFLVWILYFNRSKDRKKNFQYWKLVDE